MFVSAREYQNVRFDLRHGPGAGHRYRLDGSRGGFRMTAPIGEGARTRANRKAPADNANQNICIATAGNCQSAFLASVIASIPGVHVEYFGKQLRFHPFEGRTAPENPPEDLPATIARWRADGKRIILCQQTWPIAETAPDLDVDDVVRYPNLEAYCLWPDRKYSAEQCARLSPARLLRLDLANVRAAERQADIPVLDLYDAPFREGLSFDSERHPTAPILAKIHDRILASPAFRGVAFDRANLIQRVAASRGINTSFNHPIAAPIADALDLAWAHTEIYRRWRQAMDLQTAGETAGAARAIEDVLAMEASDPLFHRMVTPFAYRHHAALLWSLKDRAGSLRARELSIDADPYNPTWRASTARYFLAVKEPERALAVIAAARDYVPITAAMEEMAGDAELALGRRSEARACYERAIAAMPSLISAIRRIAAMDADEISSGFGALMQQVTVNKYASAKLVNEREKLAEIAASFESYRRTLLAL